MSEFTGHYKLSDKKQKCAKIVPLQVQQLVYGTVLSKEHLCAFFIPKGYQYLRVVIKLCTLKVVIYTLMILLCTLLGVNKVQKHPFEGTAPGTGCCTPTF